MKVGVYVYVSVMSIAKIIMKGLRGNFTVDPVEIQRTFMFIYIYIYL